jgi:hypothetical protein
MNFAKAKKPPCKLCKSLTYIKISAEGICSGCVDATRREAKRQERRSAKEMPRAVEVKSPHISFQFALILDKAKSSGRLACFLNE